MYSQNYESAIDASSWVTQNLAPTLTTGDATYGKYIQIGPAGNTTNTRSSYTTWGNTFYADYTTYTIEFDANFTFTTGNTRNQASSFAIMADGYVLPSANYEYSSDYIFKITSSANSTTFSVNAEDATYTMPTNVWCHYSIVVDGTAGTATYTITNKSTSSQLATGTYNIPDGKSYKAVGMYFNCGRYNSVGKFDNIIITTEVDEEVVSDPAIGVPVYAGANRTVTISSGASSASNPVTTYYTIDNSTPSASNYAGTFTTTSKEVTITSNCTVKAISISSTTVSSIVVSRAITVGKIDLNAPTFRIVDFIKGPDNYYYPKVEFSVDNSDIEGTPTATLSVSSPYTFTSKGTLTVTASHDDYNSNSATFEVTTSYVLRTIDFGAMTASDFAEDIWESATGGLRDNWTNRSAKIPADATYYKLKSPATTGANAIEGITITNPDKREPQVYIGYGLYTPYDALSGSGNNLNLTVNGATSADYAVFNGWNNYGSGTFNTLQAGNATFALYRYDTMLRTIKVYSPNPVDVAILDCKQYETSAAFTTAVEGESFASAAEVYAFHTAWQIAQAKASSSNDITKVIRNAAIDASGTDWANARIQSGQKYTEAPDEYYLDQWQSTLDSYQTIYGLPAGIYKIKAATRGSAGASGNIYVYAEGQADTNTAINKDGNTGGTLDNGWSWTEVEFTLTATSDVKIGFWADASASGQWAGCDDWHLEITGVTGTIPSSGLGSLASAYGLDFSRASVSAGTLTAYVVNEITVDKAKVTPVNEMPANSGVILEGTPGATYSIPVKADAAAFAGTNLLQAAVTATDVAANQAYILQSGEFHLVTAASTVPAGKAYLLAENVPSNAKALSFDFGDADGINTVQGSGFKVQDSEIFNLAGQRMNRLQRGVNIVNGKKILVK